MNTFGRLLFDSPVSVIRLPTGSGPTLPELFSRGLTLGKMTDVQL